MRKFAQPPMLEPDDLGPADQALLELLREGRVTAPFAAEETDYSLQYVRDRLGRFVEHGNARKVHEGLYELVEDPEEPEGQKPSPSETRQELSVEDPEPVAESDPDRGGDLEAAYREYLADRPPKKSHAKNIVVDALLLLRDRNEMETGELQDELFPKYEEHYSTDRTMWNAVSRYLKDLAGFDKSDEYGGWAYAGDDAVWEAIDDE